MRISIPEFLKKSFHLHSIYFRGPKERLSVAMTSSPQRSPDSPEREVHQRRRQRVARLRKHPSLPWEGQCCFCIRLPLSTTDLGTTRNCVLMPKTLFGRIQITGAHPLINTSVWSSACQKPGSCQKEYFQRWDAMTYVYMYEWHCFVLSRYGHCPPLCSR